MNDFLDLQSPPVSFSFTSLTLMHLAGTEPPPLSSPPILLETLKGKEEETLKICLPPPSYLIVTLKTIIQHGDYIPP